MLRNTLAVLLGLIVGIAVILSGIGVTKEWFTEIRLTPLQDWQEVLNFAPFEFFVTMLVSYGLGALLGGVTTAFFVHMAKQAYALLIGLILLLIAGIHVFSYTLPFWFEVSTFCVFFPFSWLGGKLVTIIHKK
ncbi:MAG: hypothetical protein ABI045_03160 [Flavobacteriales bacterium]